MDKTLDLDELERVAREALDDRGTTSPRVAIPADDLLTLIAAARPAVVSDEVVERMAREYHIGIHGGHEASAIPRHRRVEAMRAALALLPGGVPDGWVLVPREPTREMIKSGQGAADDKYWLWRGLGERPVGSGLDGMALYVDAAYRAMLSASPKGTSVAESAAGDASHLTASETPCKSEWPNPACPCTDPLWCIQRELCKRTTQEPPSPTPCDLEGK